MANIHYDRDADLNALKGKAVAIIGYGIQGRGQALNLRDSGVKVIVAQRPGGPNYDIAKQDGFKPVSAAEATQRADVIILLAQDTLQSQIYKESIAPNLKPGKALGFSHGFAILYGLIKPPKNVDVVMVAPKGPGSLLRSQFLEGKGVPALLAVHQDATGKAKAVALAWAKGIGSTRAGVLQTTFKEETETDNFGEQAVLCGGVSALIKAGFETLVEAGYQPELAYFECLHELKLITDMIWAGGIQGMRKRVSDTAKWGDIHCGPQVIDERVKENMRQLLRDIQSGKFAREWIAEHEAGRQNFNKLMAQDDNHQIEQVGRALRAMMPWISNQRQATRESTGGYGAGGAGRQNHGAPLIMRNPLWGISIIGVIDLGIGIHNVWHSLRFRLNLFSGSCLVLGGVLFFCGIGLLQRRSWIRRFALLITAFLAVWLGLGALASFLWAGNLDRHQYLMVRVAIYQLFVWLYLLRPSMKAQFVRKAESD